VWNAVNRYAKRHLNRRWRQWIAGSAAGLACLTLLAIGVQVAARRDSHAIQI